MLPYNETDGSKQITRNMLWDAVEHRILDNHRHRRIIPKMLFLPGENAIDYIQCLERKLTKPQYVTCIESQKGPSSAFVKLNRKFSAGTIKRPKFFFNRSLKDCMDNNSNLFTDNNLLFDVANLDFMGDSYGDHFDSAAKFIAEYTTKNFVIALTFNVNARKNDHDAIKARHLENCLRTYFDYGENITTSSGLSGYKLGRDNDGKYITPIGIVDKKIQSINGEMYGGKTDPLNIASIIMKNIYARDQVVKRRGYLQISLVEDSCHSYKSRSNSMHMNFFILHGTRT